MSEMCFDDFDYDRHSDNCECEECRAETIESAQHSLQQLNYAIALLRKVYDAAVEADSPNDQCVVDAMDEVHTFLDAQQHN